MTMTSLDNPPTCTNTHEAKPIRSASVFWVGHSLIETKALTPSGAVDLISLVGRFAEEKGLEYAAGQHTLWGSSLSALWRGHPHSYDRDASEMVAKREQFETEAEKYDTIVLTEAIPLQPVLRNEFSAYYLRLFAGALKKANPNARIYLYQTWVNLQGGERAEKGAAYDAQHWRKDMAAQRRDWEWLVDTALNARVKCPSWHNRLWPSYSDAGYVLMPPMFIVPAGNALIALADRMVSPKSGDCFTLPDDETLLLENLFENPYVRRGAKTVLKDAAKAHDDIHPSAIGIYFVALVHFAAIYRQSPVGLPDVLQLGADVAGTLQSIAWDTVLADSRAGLTQADNG